ncbi:MAG: hypothetical protein NTZ39_06455, partial [Methanoregula sp.]|nr:hypothetical protein [Methanoregula sp.]
MTGEGVFTGIPMTFLWAEKNVNRNGRVTMQPTLQKNQPDLIYLNNAATTWPKPPEVLQEVAECLRLPLHESGRTTGSGTTDYPSVTRETLAAFFHTGPPE